MRKRLLACAVLVVSAIAVNIGQTPDSLYPAIRANDLAQLKAALDRGVSASEPDADGVPPLMHAAAVGSLDAMTRDLLHDELERLWSERGLTIVFVTHDVREAVRLADRIVLLTSRPGRVAETFDVALERPRHIGTSEVGEVAGTVLERLRQEVRRHAGE